LETRIRAEHFHAPLYQCLLGVIALELVVSAESPHISCIYPRGNLLLLSILPRGWVMVLIGDLNPA